MAVLIIFKYHCFPWLVTLIFTHCYVVLLSTILFKLPSIMNIIFKPQENADYILANSQPYRSLRLSNNWSFEKLNPLSLIRQGVNKFNTSFTCFMEWICCKFSFNFFFVRSRCFYTVYLSSDLAESESSTHYLIEHDDASYYLFKNKTKDIVKLLQMIP